MENIMSLKCACWTGSSEWTAWNQEGGRFSVWNIRPEFGLRSGFGAGRVSQGTKLSGKIEGLRMTFLLGFKANSLYYDWGESLKPSFSWPHISHLFNDLNLAWLLLLVTNSLLLPYLLNVYSVPGSVSLTMASWGWCHHWADKDSLGSKMLEAQALSLQFMTLGMCLIWQTCLVWQLNQEQSKYAYEHIGN